MDLNTKLFIDFNKIYDSLSKQTKGVSLRQHEEIINEVMNTFTLAALQQDKYNEKKELLLMITHCQKYFNLVKKVKVHKYIKNLMKRYKSKRFTRRLTNIVKKGKSILKSLNKTKKGGYKIVQKETTIRYEEDGYDLQTGEEILFEEAGVPVPSTNMGTVFEEARGGAAVFSSPVPEIIRIGELIKDLTIDIECELIDGSQHETLLQRGASESSVDSVGDVRTIKEQQEAMTLPPDKSQVDNYVKDFDSFMASLEADIRKREFEVEVEVNDSLLQRAASVGSVDTVAADDIEYMKEEMMMASYRETRRQIAVARFKSFVKGLSKKATSEAAQRLSEGRSDRSNWFASVSSALSRKARSEQLVRDLNTLREKRRYDSEVEYAISRIPRLTEEERAVLKKESTIGWLDHVGILARASCFGALCGFYHTPSTMVASEIPAKYHETNYKARYDAAVEYAKAAAAPKERAALLEAFEKRLDFKDVLHITNTVVELKKGQQIVKGSKTYSASISPETLKKIGESLPFVSIDSYVDALMKTIGELAESSLHQKSGTSSSDAIKKGIEVFHYQSKGMVNNILVGEKGISAALPEIREKLSAMLQGVEVPVLWYKESIIQDVIKGRLDELNSLEGLGSVGDLSSYFKEKVADFKTGIITPGSDTFNYAFGACCCSLIGQYSLKCEQMIDARQTIKSADADYQTFKKLIKELEKDKKPTDEILEVMASLSALPPSERRRTSTACINTGALFSASGAAVATASSLLYAGGAALTPAACVIPIITSAYIGYLGHKKLQLDGDVEDNLLIITKRDEDKKSKGGKTRKRMKVRTTSKN